MMDDIKHVNKSELKLKHKCEHEGFEYYKREFVAKGEAAKSLVSIFEIPPRKAAYPYHYHLKNEETFYILSGEGILKTPEGERKVVAGDLLFFPAKASGAHKLTNSSATETLVYIDFDAIHDLDVAIYPDSNKIGIWGKDVNKVFPQDADVDYYEGE